MKKTSQFYFLLLFSVSLFLFPIFFTQAKPITITPCTPASAVGSNQTQKCIIDQTVVPTVVKLNWNIAKQF
ncbi:MAG: hypothetical protein NTV48_01095, partial [Candidatus Vogelbacteria bacterium]|nr:hypothetical protein [Candidatus Vogelbacteria bacterium]